MYNFPFSMERRFEASNCPGFQRSLGGSLVPPVPGEDRALPREESPVLKTCPCPLTSVPQLQDGEPCVCVLVLVLAFPCTCSVTLGKSPSLSGFISSLIRQEVGEISASTFGADQSLSLLKAKTIMHIISGSCRGS